MKRLWLCVAVVTVVGFGLVEGCGPSQNQEATPETVTESTTEAVSDTQADGSTSEISQEPHDASESTPEPSTEPSPEPTVESAAEPTQETVPEGGTTDGVVSDGGGETVPGEGIAEGGSEGPVVDGGVADGAPQESTPEKATAIFNFTGRVFDFFASGNPPMEGVKICVYQKPQFPCATSDKSGNFMLSNLPLNTDLYITFENSAKKLMPLMVPLNVPASEIDSNRNLNQGVGLLTKQAALAVGGLMGVSNIDLTNKTHFVADVHDRQLNPTAGVTITLNPKAGDGPFYLTASGTKNPKGVTASPGIAVILNVPPGPSYTFTYKHASQTCSSWPTSIRTANGASSRADAFKGWLIVTSGLCK